MPETASQPRLLVVWHSFTGATRALAEALCVAANEAGDTALQVNMLHASQAQAEDVLAANAVVFATPETLASMSGAMKDFFDRSYYALLDRCQGKAYAVLVCAGSDGHPSIAQLQRIATGLRLREIAPPLLVNTHAQTPERILAAKRVSETDLERAADLGALLAAGLAMGIY